MSRHHLPQRRGIGLAVLVGVDLGRGDDDEVGQLRPVGLEPRHRHAAEDAVPRQRLDHLAALPGTRMVNSLKNESLRTLTPGTSDKRFREAAPRWRG